ARQLLKKMTGGRGEDQPFLPDCTKSSSPFHPFRLADLQSKLLATFPRGAGIGCSGLCSAYFFKLKPLAVSTSILNSEFLILNSSFFSACASQKRASALAFPFFFCYNIPEQDYENSAGKPQVRTAPRIPL
ncbi:MAG: hypothetical protein II889_11610, partial [Clostridia bacterium]|nr:hypothetical protein [Clostridia bacterium]